MTARSFIVPIFIALSMVLAGPADALPEWRTGTIQQIYVDPGDVVLILSVSGPCGSTMFHIPRGNVNFKEFYAAMLIAFTEGKTVSVHIASCSDERNILTHGSVIK